MQHVSRDHAEMQQTYSPFISEHARGKLVTWCKKVAEFHPPSAWNIGPKQGQEGGVKSKTAWESAPQGHVPELCRVVSALSFSDQS